METQTNQPESPVQPKASRLSVWWRYTRDLLSIHESTDVEATVTSISQSVEFRGVNIWVLFFAILIASIGLNVNSTAVIIGAMLISPLMGPINGIGLAVGTFDVELLKRSGRNLGLMVGISLLASTLYFLLSPLGDAQSELLARTRPTIFDVLIATFGGLAGIVASSRKSQSFTIISGVAIATALMPPLCTAGYGIATWQLRYFIGAFYLFFINSFFIAFSTFLIVRYLHFPQHKFVNEQREKLVKRTIYLVAVLVTIPSIFAAINVVKESLFNASVVRFANDIRRGKYLPPETILLNYEKSYDRKNPSVTLSMVGNQLTDKEMNSLQNIMRHQYGLTNADLLVKQTGSEISSDQQADVLERLLQRKEDEIRSKDLLISQLRDSIKVLSTSMGNEE